MEQAKPQHGVERLAVQSLQQQQQMIDLLQELGGYLARQSAAAMENFNITFRSLQEETKHTDLCLQKALYSSEISVTARQLLVRRKSLQKHILLLLKESMPQALNIKSLLANEMQTLKTGRRAICGYKNGSERQGKIINRVR